MESLLERIDQIEDDLVARDFLYDDPTSYREGIDETIRRVRLVVSKVSAGPRLA